MNNSRGFQKNSNFKGHVKPLGRKANTAIFLHCLCTWRKATGKKFHCWYGVIFGQNRNILGLVQPPNFSWGEPYSNKGRPKLWRPAELSSDADLNFSRTKLKRRKTFTSVNLLTKYLIITYAFGSVHEKFDVNLGILHLYQIPVCISNLHP